MASQELAMVHELLRGFDLEDLTIADRRAAMTSAAAPPPPGTTVEPVGAGGVPAEWVIAAGVDSVRVLLYLHGGAYQVGAPATLRRMIATISAVAQVRVLSVGYRLAPEHPFPAAVDDALAAYRFLLKGGTDPAVIAIAGDSSGGGLALATLVALRDAGDPLPAAAVAMSPWTDLALTGESMSTRADVDLMIKPDGMRESAVTYLAGVDPRHPYARPGSPPRHAPPGSTSRWKSGTRCRTSGTRSSACCPSPARRSSGSAAGSTRTTRAGQQITGGQASVASASRPASSAGRVNIGQWPDSMSA